MIKTAQLVKDLAETRRVTLYDDHASFLADQFNRIDGVEGDETLRLIADLMRAKAISSKEGGNLVLAHVRELTSAVADGAGAGNELGKNPWEPAEDGIILRNKFGATTKAEIDSLEFSYSRANMGRALEMLKLEKEITLDSWLKCHAILFGEIYPWAGQLRHLDTQRGHVAFNFVPEIEDSTNQILLRAADPSFFRNNLGQIYSVLAFNHPFLDGNGRSLNVVFTELARRDDVGISWDRVDKPTYLSALRSGIMFGLYEPLQFHLYDRLVILDCYDPEESLTSAHKPK